MFLLPWLLAILLALLDEWVSTILLRCEYTHHRLAWESDGKPRGVFWIPDECRIGWYITYASGHAAQIVEIQVATQNAGLDGEQPAGSSTTDISPATNALICSLLDRALRNCPAASIVNALLNRDFEEATLN
jgi:hypothetical protein